MPNTPKKITKEMLVANEIAYITGTVSFSHITKPYEGAALEKYNEGRQYPATSPFTTISIENVRIECLNGPQNPSILEQYIGERLYRPKNNPSTYGYTASNKTKNLPMVGHKNPQTGQIDEVILENELANGSSVTIMMKSYTSKSGNGVGLELIIVNDPVIKYYEPNGIASKLAARGITWNALPKDERERQQAVQAANAAAQAPASPQPQQPYPASTQPSPQEQALMNQAQQYTTPQYQDNGYAAPADPGFYGGQPAADGYQEAAYGGYTNPQVP